MLFTVYSIPGFSQPGEWVWIHGSNASASPGNFGTKGMASATNEPPALYEACEWTDLQGNFWLYGGLDYNASVRIHNDLWKYDPVINQWTWMTGTQAYNDSGVFGIKGVASAANRPPSIGFGGASWTDLQGNLWMLGGAWYNSSLGSESNLWKYDISTNIWTWVNGPGLGYQPGVYGIQGVPDTANYPGGRSECATAWTDNAGDLWLFGGTTGGNYNDLWRYNIATNRWTWMTGSNILNQNGLWGTIGIESAANTPSARWAYTRWKDNVGNLWLFGGIGKDSSGASGWYLNDLWRYNVATNNWTWMNGSSLGSNTFMGDYGTKCVTSATNQPPPRTEDRAAWTDANGNFWLFGGFFRTSPFNSFAINDLWMYCVSQNKWTWEGGDNTPNTLGNWGTLNVSSPANKPSPRVGSLGWTDHQGHLYLFGGIDGGYSTIYNDLWKFTIDNTCGTCPSALPTASFTSSDTAFCDENGKCINFFDHSTGNPTSWHWIFTGATPSSSNLQNPDSICYTQTGTYPVTLIVTNSGGTDTLVVSPLIIMGAGPSIPTINQIGDTLYSSHASTYQWYYNGNLITGATDSFYVCGQQGTYAVLVTDSIGCSKISTGVSGCLTAINDVGNNLSIKIFPNPASKTLGVWGLEFGVKYTIELYSMLGEKLYGKQLLTPNTKHQTVVDISSLAKGVYFVCLKSESNHEIIYRGKLIKE